MEGSILVMLLLSFIGATVMASNPDAITNLPGLVKQPSFSQYSGYLTVVDGRMLHYWFVESQGTPKTDPLILWTNGGPGCSSMLGILTENGPFTIQDDGVTLAYNDNSWNMFANVLYIESPAGVGFSYAPDGNVTTNDDQITDDHYAALVDFYQKYPDMKNNVLFLIGESYSGVYTPLLSAKVLKEIDNGTLPGVTFGGFAAGNGVTNYALMANSLMYFLYNHGIIGQRLWNALVQNCCNGPQHCNFYNATSDACTGNVTHARMILQTSGINGYNILAKCAGAVSLKAGHFTHSRELDLIYRGTPVEMKLKKKLQFFPQNKLSSTPPCLNYTSLTTYLNNVYTKTALHIKADLPDWSPCNDEVGEKYQVIYTDLAPIYVSVLSNLSHKVRILLYNGDLDTACNFLGDQWFVDALGAEDEVQWRPWLYNDGTDQVAGFVKEYNEIAFATVKGAGHMSPQDKPIAASQLINNFITGKPY